MNCTLHRTTEGNAIGELVCNALGDECSIEFRGLDLNDVELDARVTSDLGDHLAKLVCLGTFTTNHDARAGSVNVDAELVTGAFDLDSADCRSLETLHHRIANLPVLGEVLLVITIAEPAALPIGAYAEAEAIRVDLLTH